ncbi:unnamed protein product [Oikopleura dioica]|uniref:Uncharacterized protein n=1 Tax=Oikopleura dioica TaxID=34765 RepID=E4Y4D5_OIKDI|nr:unnamed protein product [Oikopleura dioica]
MKTKIIFLLFAVAASWGDPFIFPADYDNKIARSNNWRMLKRKHPIGKRNMDLRSVIEEQERMAHPFYEQAKRAEEDQAIQKEEMQRLLNKLVAIEIAKES